MITRHIHIAVLDTDVPVPTVYAARGLYSSQFRVLLQSAATRLNQSIKNNAVSASQIQIHTSAYDVVGGSYPALGMLRKTPPLHDEEKEEEEEEEEEVFRPIDAILITGSAASAYYQGEQYAWVTKLQEFIRRVWSRYPHIKFFGSCFGHQVIAQALLATPQKDSSLETPLVRVEACPMGYEIGIQPIEISREFGATALGKTFSKSLNERDGGKLHIQLIHGDRVIGFHPPSTAGASETSSLPPAAAAALTALPQPWLNLGSTLLSPIQGLYYPGRVLTYQGHFEFDIFVNSETVIEFGRRTGWDAQMVAESLQKVNACGLGDDDSKAAAEIVVQFLAEDADIARQGVTETGAPMKIDYPMKAETARSAAASGLATPPEEMSLPV